MKKLFYENAHVTNGNGTQDPHLQFSAADSSTKDVVRREKMNLVILKFDLLFQLLENYQASGPEERTFCGSYQLIEENKGVLECKGPERGAHCCL